MRFITAALICFIIGWGAPKRAEAASVPQRVSVLGYVGDIMEPFLSRDGSVLFFNNRNSPPQLTDLHWAVRADDLTFIYLGPVVGANELALDAVPTMAFNGSFCFISSRSYPETLRSVYCGLWSGGGLIGVTLQRRLLPSTLGRAMFDVELSADATELLLADGLFDGNALPRASNLRFARWDGTQYVLSPETDHLLDAVNSDQLEYGAALSADGLTIAFTRLRALLPRFSSASIWVARRTARDQPFGIPRRLRNVTGFSEGPTFSPDGRAIYYHKLENDVFTLWRVALN